MVNSRKPPQSAEEMMERYSAGERDFRYSNLTDADLSRAYLIGVNLEGADLSRAILSHAKLFKAEFTATNRDDEIRELNGLKPNAVAPRRYDLSWNNTFYGQRAVRTVYSGMPDIVSDETGTLCTVHITRTNLSNTNLSEINLEGTDLTSVNLSGANLSQANLSWANLSLANLSRASLCGANLFQTNLEGVWLWRTTLGDLNLSQANLNDVQHQGPSSIGVDTLRRTAASLGDGHSNQGSIEAFFRLCGVHDDDIAYFRTLIGKPFDFYSVFISHSSDDKDFARRLHDALQGRGIRCWLDEKQILPGDDIRDAIDKGIKLWDKLILCCSEAALANSWWVEDELNRILNKEAQYRKAGHRVMALIPLTIDDYVFDSWESSRKDTVTERKVADFRGWKDHDTFEAALEQLIKALRTDNGGREDAPKPMLPLLKNQ